MQTMLHLFKTQKKDLNLFSPSLLSLVFGLVVGVVMTGSFFVFSQIDSQANQPETYGYQQDSEESDLSENAPSGTVATLVSNIPLFIIWGGTGYIAYLFVIGTIGAFRSVEEVSEKIHRAKTKTRKHHLLIRSMEHLTLRVVTLILWFLFAKYSLHGIFSYIFSVGHAATVEDDAFMSMIYIGMVVGLLVILCHVHTIFIRLICLKPRVFNRRHLV